MYRISAEAIIDGDLDRVWAVATEVNNWAGWDPHLRSARMHGPFTAGGTGWSKPRGGPGASWTVTGVTERCSWSSECPLPGGTPAGRNEYGSTSDGRVRCTETVCVTGPMVPLFQLHFGRRIRRDMVATFAALERAAAAA